VEVGKGSQGQKQKSLGEEKKESTVGGTGGKTGRVVLSYQLLATMKNTKKRVEERKKKNKGDQAWGGDLQHTRGEK